MKAVSAVGSIRGSAQWADFRVPIWLGVGFRA